MNEKANIFSKVNKNIVDAMEKIENKINDLIHKTIMDRANFWVDEISMSFIDEEAVFNFKGKVYIEANPNFKDDEDKTVDVAFEYLPVYELTLDELAVMMFATIYKLDI